MNKIYRVHFICPPYGHKTYTDYKTKRAAIRNWLVAFDGWQGHYIEVMMWSI